MVRVEMKLWFISGKWGASYETVETAYPTEVMEPEYVCEDPEDVSASMQEYLDGKLVMLDAAQRPVYRRVASIEEDILWKFHGCEEFVEMGEEQPQDDAIMHSHYFVDAARIREGVAVTTESFLIPLIEEINSIFDMAGGNTADTLGRP